MAWHVPSQEAEFQVQIALPARHGGIGRFHVVNRHRSVEAGRLEQRIDDRYGVARFHAADLWPAPARLIWRA